MNTYRDIKLLTENGVGTLVLNRPPLNVMNIAMMEEISAALEVLKESPTTRVLVIRAEGKAFSAGVDIADHTADRVDGMMKEFHRMFEVLLAFRVPSVAVVDGAALGGGCELAISCDMVIASERAKFGQPEIKVGVFPPVAAALFPRLVGRNRSLDLLMSGDTITAADAERIGLINRTFPVDGFDQHVHAFLSRFTVQSRVVLEWTKKAVDGGLRRSCMEAIGLAEDLYMNHLMKTEDASEGLQAFMERRQPQWKNR